MSLEVLLVLTIALNWIEFDVEEPIQGAIDSSKNKGKEKVLD